jgi:hypothetical protein
MQIYDIYASRKFDAPPSSMHDAMELCITKQHHWPSPLYIIGKPWYGTIELLKSVSVALISENVWIL